MSDKIVESVEISVETVKQNKTNVSNEQEEAVLALTCYEVTKVTETVNVKDKANSKFLVWVDPNPANNQEILQSLDKSIHYKIFCSTLDTVTFFQNDPSLIDDGLDKLRIITNMVRDENGVKKFDAGLELINGMRSIDYKGLIFIYCGQTTKDIVTQKEDLKANYGDFMVECDLQICKNFASFKNIQNHSK